MEDGKGQLADGTRYERTTSEEYGPDGYWLRTTIMRGVSAQGQVHCRCAQPPQASGRTCTHIALAVVQGISPPRWLLRSALRHGAAMRDTWRAAHAPS